MHAPGVVFWALSHYWHEPDRKMLEEFIANGWKIPIEAARALLSEKTPYKVEGETVVFTV